MRMTQRTLNRMMEQIRYYKPAKKFFCGAQEDFEPPSLYEVEQEEFKLGSTIDEYIADQRDQQGQRCHD